MTQAYGTSNATTTSYTYDAAGRKLSETDLLSHTTTYTYDAAGNLTGVSGVKGNRSYAYDNARNQIAITDGNNNTTQFQYDARKRLVTTAYPDSTTKTNAYDGPGNLISMTDQAGNVVEYTYDAANQLQTVVQTNSPNTSANTTSYSYNLLGDITGLTDAKRRVPQVSFLKPGIALRRRTMLMTVFAAGVEDAARWFVLVSERTTCGHRWRPT